LVAGSSPAGPTNKIGSLLSLVRNHRTRNAPLPLCLPNFCNSQTLLFPFRRSLDRPWGNIILRIGSMGNEEDFLDRAPPKQSDDLQAHETEFAIPEKSETLAEELKPKRGGEPFVYLNKPVLGLWGYESWLSDLIGNTGRTKILIEKI
jgi:hypothetical protein